MQGLLFKANSHILIIEYSQIAVLLVLSWQIVKNIYCCHL